ncbi:MAG: hypothetical protein M1608_01315, partial [Candidatus Omnitrophica bacterium]|nr:hypothetical protein [Candidatus Omnitrophota bacterium]
MNRQILLNHSRLNRRRFLRATGILAVGATCGRGMQPAAEPVVLAAHPQNSAIGGSGSKPAPLLRIGALLGTFGQGTLEGRLDAAKACGLHCAQVSMDCAGLPAMPDNIPPELPGRIRRAAADRGIIIASVQGTFNMSHPSPMNQPALFPSAFEILSTQNSICYSLGINAWQLLSSTD